VSGAAQGAGPVAVVGAGAWGTALAGILGTRYPDVLLWVYEADLAREMERARENRVYLAGVRLPAAVRPTSALEALADRTLVVLVVPSHAFRSVLEQCRPYLNPEALIVSATKGLEVGTLKTMSQVALDLLPPSCRGRIAVLSGPSFAAEVAAGRPTAIVGASADVEIARTVQQVLSGDSLRVYAGTDPLGAEIGGAVKNVVAIAAGVVDGLGLGPNARAALLTRGLAEMMRLGTALGARPRTLAGLAGMGDLILTCTSDLSRNRRLGLAVAAGTRLEAHLASSRSVAEGVNTCRSTLLLARMHGVEMPICQAVHRVLFEGQDPKQVVIELMARHLKFEDA
jgi:glycerol-3-phosphate dehydrogenase (NAD(P)+)